MYVVEFHNILDIKLEPKKKKKKRKESKNKTNKNH